MDAHVKERKISQRRARTETGPAVNPDGVVDTMVRGSFTRSYFDPSRNVLLTLFETYFDPVGNVH